MLLCDTTSAENVAFVY